MAVAFDALSGNGALVTTNISWTHTPVGTPKGVCVSVKQTVTSADQVSGVTYGGVAMAAVAGSPLLHATAEAGTVYEYFLGSGIPTGAQTIVVTVTGAASKIASAISVTADTDTELVDVETWNLDSQASPSATLSLTGRACFCLVELYSGQNAIGGIAPLTGWTDQGEADLGSQSVATYTYDTVGTVDVTAGWTQAADDAVGFAMAVGEVVPPGGGGKPWLHYAGMMN